MSIFEDSFIEAALWADTPEEAPGAGLSPESEAAMRAYAAAFYDANAAMIEAYPEGEAQAGHDLWFNIAGHGCGYWEGSDAASVALDAAAQNRDVSLYLGDDGQLYAYGL